MKRQTPIDMVISELKGSLIEIEPDTPIYACGVEDGKMIAINALLRHKAVEKIFITELRNVSLYDGLTCTTGGHLTGEKYYKQEFEEEE